MRPKDKKGKEGSRRVVFKKADYERFAQKLRSWSDTLSAEERALLLVVLDKGSSTIRAAGSDTLHTATMTESVAAEPFDIGQFIVELLLAIEGISAEVDEDGPSFIEEITVGKT